MKDLTQTFGEDSRELQFVNALSEWIEEKGFQDVAFDTGNMPSNFQLAHNFIQDLRSLAPGEGRTGAVTVTHEGQEEFVVEIKRLRSGEVSNFQPFRPMTFCIICLLPRPHCCAG
jgi:hypothetical protein